MTEQKEFFSPENYCGPSNPPPRWGEKIRALLMHKRRTEGNEYSTEVGNKLYHELIEKLRKISNEFGLHRARKNKDQIVNNYPQEWRAEHFKQLLIQLGEWKD